MSFRITGLDPEPFRPFFGMSDERLRSHGVIRYVADEKPAFPDRIEMRDVEIGETVLLVNHLHQPAENAYRASHAIFVREGALLPYDRIDEIPAVIGIRTVSLRAFDANDMMTEADLFSGAELPAAIERFFSDPRVAYLHAHYAKRGGYAARTARA